MSPAANQAQIAAAVTDATCTESADLAGIYFAVQASYEQQIVNANQQRSTPRSSSTRPPTPELEAPDPAADRQGHPSAPGQASGNGPGRPQKGSQRG